jgi:hypothetical protein
MKMVLQPCSGRGRVSLRGLYDKAVTEATELFVLSAYLTDWLVTKPLGRECREVSFIVGIDFGRTSKDACRAVLKWLPRGHKHDFLAADRITGFHPKLLMWKDRLGRRNLLVGSSNLTQAAFSVNHEANTLLRINGAQYDQIRQWVYAIREKGSPISEDWLAKYTEKPLSGERRGGGAKSRPPIPVIPIKLPKGRYLEEAIRGRRLNQRRFALPRRRLTRLIRLCASGRKTDSGFYEDMRQVWKSVQGTGWTRSCKGAKWRDVCRGLTAVLDCAGGVSRCEPDNAVGALIDNLAESKPPNPTRKAWLTELLCRYFPDSYPLLNTPVVTWLKHIHYGPDRRGTEGSKYIDLAIKLRQAIKQNRYNTARNLIELDGAIWKWYERYGE